MTIEVSYEPRHIFDDRIKNKYQNIIYLDEFLIYLGGEQKESLLIDEEKLGTAEALVLTSEGSSRLLSHVFERLPIIFESLLENYDNIYVNNPPDILVRAMGTLEDVVYKDPYYYKNITEEEIIKLWEVFDTNNEIIGQKVAKKVF